MMGLFWFTVLRDKVPHVGERKEHLPSLCSQEAETHECSCSAGFLSSGLVNLGPCSRMVPPAFKWVFLHLDISGSIHSAILRGVSPRWLQTFSRWQWGLNIISSFNQEVHFLILDNYNYTWVKLIYFSGYWLVCMYELNGQTTTTPITNLNIQWCGMAK